MLFLWKLHREILPTKVFLAKRLGLDSGQILCSTCNKYEETSIHIFWKCDSAKILWVKVIAWWGFVGRIYIEDLCSMWNSCYIFPHGLCRQVWQITMIACLWTLWLERNNVHFSGRSMSVKGLFALLKCRSLEWCIAVGLISIEKASWWDVNPMGVITASLKLKEQMATSADTDLVAFIDGSFKSITGNNVKGGAKGGVGGMIKSHNGKKILEFSGPTNALNALEAERNSLSTLFQILQRHNWSYSSITFFQTIISWSKNAQKS